MTYCDLRVIVMKRKKINDVYMNEVKEKRIFKTFDKRLNSYIMIKYIDEMSDTCSCFINGKKITILDKNYAILEYTPLDLNYNVRVFIDNNGKILEYYFDVIDKMLIIDDDIYYDDLYLDVIYHTKNANGCCGYISLSDEKELIKAFNNKDITKKQFDMAYKVALKLMDELRNKSNKFVKRGNKDYIKCMKGL